MSLERRVIAPVAGLPSPTLWRRVVPTIAAFAAVIVCIAAGNWQRHRMEAKETLRAQLDAAAALQPVALPDAADWEPWRFRRVIARGVFDAKRQILIDNRVHAGVVGYEVVTPLALADGRTVLVDRGFVAGGRSRADLPDVPPPSGAVSVDGRINITPARYFELSREAPQGAVWPHLDPTRFAEATGVRVLPIVIETMAPTGAGETLIRDRPPPDLGIERHLIYMWQWYAFAAMAFGLWFWFTVLRGRRAK